MSDPNADKPEMAYFKTKLNFSKKMNVKVLRRRHFEKYWLRRTSRP